MIGFEAISLRSGPVLKLVFWKVFLSRRSRLSQAKSRARATSIPPVLQAYRRLGRGGGAFKATFRPVRRVRRATRQEKNEQAKERTRNKRAHKEQKIATKERQQAQGGILEMF